MLVCYWLSEIWTHIININLSIISNPNIVRPTVAPLCLFPLQRKILVPPLKDAHKRHRNRCVFLIPSLHCWLYVRQFLLQFLQFYVLLLNRNNAGVIVFGETYSIFLFGLILQLLYLSFQIFMNVIIR